MPGPPDKIVVLNRAGSTSTQSWANALSTLYEDSAKNGQAVEFLFNGGGDYSNEYAFRVGSYSVRSEV